MAAFDRLRAVIGRRESSLAYQSIVLTAARALGFAATLAIPFVLVRIFDAWHVGLYKQIFLISTTAVPMLSLGLYASLYYFVPRDERGGQQFLQQALVVLGSSGAAAALALWLGAAPIARALGSPEIAAYLPVLALFVLLATPAGLANCAPVLDRRPLLAGAILAGGDIVRAALIVATAVATRSILAVLWAAVAATALRLLVFLLYLRARRSPLDQAPDRRALLAQLKYSLPFAAAVVCEIALGRYHEYFVSANVTPDLFAIYAIGVLPLPVVGMLVQSIVEVMQIRVADSFRAGDTRAVTELWNRAVMRLACILVPVWALVELLAPDVLTVAFGATYAASAPVLRIFSLTILSWIVVDHGVLRATGDTPFLLRANAAGLLASVLAVALLTPHHLMLGAVWAYVIGVFTARLLGVLRVARRLGVPVRDVVPAAELGRLGLAVGASAAVAVAALGLALPAAHPAVRVVVGASLYGATYLGLATHLRLVPRSEVRALVGRLLPAYR